MKKTDVAEPPEVFDHVGLLVNKPPADSGLPFVSFSDFIHLTTSIISMGPKKASTFLLIACPAAVRTSTVGSRRASRGSSGRGIRSRRRLPVSPGEDWEEAQKERAAFLFGEKCVRSRQAEEARPISAYRRSP
jgi:hypothetical protein